MKVVLAGFNVEAEWIERIKKKDRESFTPEVISAAYARISRDPRSVGALRRDAREEVERARISNERIVFGLGHSSVAEHAVFNFDIMGVSRLAVEEIEHFRLASFTEKSQRYIRLGRDLVIPLEIKAAGLEGEFKSVMLELHSAYETLLERILISGEKEGVAKEDARYLMPLATSAQLGMTVNARELEYMISRLASHPLDELRTLAGKMYSRAGAIAPSLIRYPEPTRYFSGMPSKRREIIEAVAGTTGWDGGERDASGKPEGHSGDETVRLIDSTPDGDTRLAAALIFSSGSLSFDEALMTASALSPSGRAALIAKTMKQMQSHDGVWREFENVHMVFELVVSSSCFAQLKRHRMATLIPQPYDTSLGLSIPRSVRKAKAVKLFRQYVSKTERLHRRLAGKIGAAAEYALTNAHRRRVIIDMNLREMYHFSRLRSDRSAQWEIREISDRMCNIVCERFPAGSILLCGKDRFSDKKTGPLFDK